MEGNFVNLTSFSPPPPTPNTNETEAMRCQFTALQADLTEKIAEKKLSYDNHLEEARARTENALSSLRKENEIVRREMVEQLLFYENQRAEDQSKAEQVSAAQEAKIEKMIKDLEDLQVTMSSNVAEFVSRRDFAASQATLMERIAELKLSTVAGTGAKSEEALSNLRDENKTVRRELAEQKLSFENQLSQERADAYKTLTSLRNENETIRQALTAEKAKAKEAEAKIAEMAVQLSDYVKQLSEINEVNRFLNVEANITRQIHRAFEECPYFKKTPEKVKRIYVKVKKDKLERPVKCLKTQDLVDEIKKSQRLNTMPSKYLILYRGESIIARERLSQDPVPSLDYIKLILALFEYV
jgi:hypothetical protein